MSLTTCVNCRKAMNGGVYRKPNLCPHCGTLQDPTRDARNRPLTQAQLIQNEREIREVRIAKTQPIPELANEPIKAHSTSPLVKEFIKKKQARSKAQAKPTNKPLKNTQSSVKTRPTNMPKLKKPSLTSTVETTKFQSNPKAKPVHKKPPTHHTGSTPLTFAALPTDEYEAITDEMLEKSPSQVMADIEATLAKLTGQDKAKKKTAKKVVPPTVSQKVKRSKPKPKSRAAVEKKTIEESLDIELKFDDSAVLTTPKKAHKTPVKKQAQKQPAPTKKYIAPKSRTRSRVGAVDNVAPIKKTIPKKNFKQSDQYEKIVLTTENSQNIAIEKRFDIVTAECVFETSMVKSDLAKVPKLVKKPPSLDVLKDARRTVLDCIKKEAHLLGANTVVGLNLNYSEITRGKQPLMLIVATGTAVLTKVA